MYAARFKERYGQMRLTASLGAVVGDLKARPLISKQLTDGRPGSTMREECGRDT